MGITWNRFIKQESEKMYFRKLMKYIEEERLKYNIYPQENEVYKAFDLCPFDTLQVVIVGQDPYHQKGQAMGLSFSVHNNMALPKSLVNIFKELEADCGIKNQSGDLSNWAKQGVFLINRLLTVRDSSPLSHENKGWEQFTLEAIRLISENKKHVVFILWGKKAQTLEKEIAKRHSIIKAPHPSPLSSYRGFFGSKPFSKTNEILRKKGGVPIDWST